MLSFSLKRYAFLTLALLFSISSFAEIKIGVVDMQRALQTVSAGKKARTELESEFNKKKTELQKEEEEIKKMHQDFEKKSGVMNQEAKQKKQVEIQQRIMQVQEKTARYQADIQKKERDLTKPIIDNLRKSIAQLAEKKGYSTVLEKNENTVLYSKKEDDLTDEVIKNFK